MDETIQVRCYAGFTGEETPRAVVYAGQGHEVAQVLERWIEEAQEATRGRRRWYRVVFRDGTEATIYRDLALDMWFLSRRRGRAADPGGDPEPAEGAG